MCLKGSDDQNKVLRKTVGFSFFLCVKVTYLEIYTQFCIKTTLNRLSFTLTILTLYTHTQSKLIC